MLRGFFAADDRRNILPSRPPAGQAMLDELLRADCSRCAALCCVALAFDRSALFAFDKPAGVPCPHLGPDLRCGIHACRAQEGFAGCVAYDCSGAGQRATALFGGRALRPEVLPDLLEAFRVLREVHQSLGLLLAAGRLPLTPALATQRTALLQALQPAEGWTAQACAAFDESGLRQAMRKFLADLRSC
jgi:hypothetical protein